LEPTNQDLRSETPGSDHVIDIPQEIPMDEQTGPEFNIQNEILPSDTVNIIPENAMVEHSAFTPCSVAVS
jgi:hypothetical protein